MKRTKPCSASKAIRAKCAECMAFYADGHKDCGIPTCPLYAWNRLGKEEANLWWVNRKLCQLYHAYFKAKNS